MTTYDSKGNLLTTLSYDVLSKYKNKIFVETGTSSGHAVEIALKCGFSKIISIEINPKLVEFNKQKFENEIKQGIIEIIEGDTFSVFDKIMENIKDQATFWLDAHWDGGPYIGKQKCPLLFELEAIKKHPIKTHTILIDDRRLFGSSYGTWGHEVTENAISESIIKINSSYKIKYENGIIPNDILTAYFD